MIICLYGEDSYRRNQKVRELTAAYEKKHAPIDMAVFDLEDAPDDWRRVKDFLNQPSMFVDTKLVVIKEAQAVDEKEWIKTLKEQVNAERTFVIISDKKSPRKEFRFLLKEPVKSQEFGELEGAALAGFLKKEAAARGLEFADDASRFFLAYIADSKERSVLTVGELEKLYLAGFGEKISSSRLQTIVRFEKKEEVWRAASAVLRGGGTGRRLGVLEKMFLQREEPRYVFNSLGFQAKGAAALQLADYDVSLKSGGLEYEEALTDFILSS